MDYFEIGIFEIRLKTLSTMQVNAITASYISRLRIAFSNYYSWCLSITSA